MPETAIERWWRFVRDSRTGPLALALVIILGGWSALASVLSPEILPSPQNVFARMIELLTGSYMSRSLLGHIGISISRVFAGFGLGVLCGIALGYLIYSTRILREGIEFVLSLLLPLPPFTLIAVFIIWFGLGEAPKIALIFFGVFARMAIYAASAFEALPATLLDAARSMGASPRQIFWRVRLPAALPDLFVGLRILLALAWTSVMGAELIAANEGIGWMIWTAARNVQTDVVFVGILSIATIGALMDAALIFVATRFTGGWAARMRGQ